MDKMNYPRGLIRYSTLNALEKRADWREMIVRVFRPRVLLYTAILWTIIIAAGITLWNRVPVRADVIRDRTTLAREVAGGQIENVYRLQIMNTQEKVQRFTVGVRGVEGLRVYGVEQPLEIGPAASNMFAISLRMDMDAAPKGISKIEFDVTAVDTHGRAAPDVFSLHEKSSFYRP
jgi:polyferredoxin